MNPLRIESERLELIEATPELAAANLRDAVGLSRLLSVRLPASWPPEHWEPAAIQWIIDMAERNGGDRGWGGWYVVLRRGQADGDDDGGVLIGTVGCKGPPDAAGIIEVGYGIVSEFQRQGFASEATRALIERALRDARVKSIVAETYPHLTASLGVMRRLGMTLLGDGSEPGTVRYGAAREAFAIAER